MDWNGHEMKLPFVVSVCIDDDIDDGNMINEWLDGIELMFDFQFSI